MRNSKGSFLAEEIMREYREKNKWKKYYENKKKGGVMMFRVEVTEEFTLDEFDEITEVVRISKEKYGKLFVGDTFVCSEKLKNKLVGDNKYRRAFVNVIEKIPKEKPKTNITRNVVKKNTKRI